MNQENNQPNRKPINFHTKILFVSLYSIVCIIIISSALGFLLRGERLSNIFIFAIAVLFGVISLLVLQKYLLNILDGRYVARVYNGGGTPTAFPVIIFSFLFFTFMIIPIGFLYLILDDTEFVGAARIAVFLACIGAVFAGKSVTGFTAERKFWQRNT